MLTETKATAANINGAPMRDLLNGQADARSFADKVKAAPKALRSWLMATLKTFKLDAAAGVVVDAGKWTLSKLSPVFNLLRKLGMVNIAGLFVTIPPLRRYAVKVAHTVYKVVTAPIRWFSRAIAWGLNQFGWGRTVVAAVTANVEKAEAYVATKVEAGLTWMETHETHGAMKTLRWMFQARIVQAAIRIAFPNVAGWVPYVVSLMVPTLNYVPAEEAAIKRAHTILDTLAVDLSEVNIDKVTDNGGVIDKTEVTEPMVHTTQPGTIETLVLTDSSKPADDPGRRFEAASFVDDSGIRRIRLGQRLIAEDELPDSMTIVGIHQGEILLPAPDDIEKTVREAQATSGGKPPTLSRAPRRAAKGKRTAGTRT